MSQRLKNDDKTPLPGSIEYHNRSDKRKRAKERLLTSPYVSDDILEESQRHGKVHQIQFKISPFVAKVGEEVADLFNMSLSQYCKALLYLNLGLVNEPLDRRRKQIKFHRKDDVPR